MEKRIKMGKIVFLEKSLKFRFDDENETKRAKRISF